MNPRNRYNFFKNIKLSDDGALIISHNKKKIPVTKEGNQYKVYGKVVLTEEGFLKTTTE